MRLRSVMQIAAIATALAFAPAAGAGEQTPTHESGHDGDAGHGAHRHHVSGLVGIADNGAIDETAFTFGAGYRYALNDRFAIGPSIDFASYDHEDTMLLVAALYWKPAGNLLLMAGPGVEFVDYKGSSHATPHDAATSESAHEDESKFAFRVGAGYEVHAGAFTVTPAVGADFIDGHTTMVYALSVGFGF